MLGFKLGIYLVLGIAMVIGSSYYAQTSVEPSVDTALRQFDDTDMSAKEVRVNHWSRNAIHRGAAFGWLILGVLFFASDVCRVFVGKKSAPLAVVALSLLLAPGCAKPFEPIKLETIGTSEEGFLIPYAGDGKKQTSSNSEEYLKANLVYSKQIRLPQQWIATGYETWHWNGAWQDAAKLIKVDRAPVTREWTADPNSGTSNKNEAIWVMTSDQVEFSTGWTCTARIASRDDAVKFLHNYPVGSIKDVLDTEVRAKIQATFGLEVTDLPMDTLRKAATPHILKTTAEVTTFFSERGITITNLGITGGFIYKNTSIVDTMARVFNAEQERSIAAAATAAQDEKNKQIEMQAKGKAQALLTERQAEADGIKMVADAKAYEISKAKEDLKTYIDLKRIEIEKEKLLKWDGRFPTTFMGTGGSGLDMLLQVPALRVEN